MFCEWENDFIVLTSGITFLKGYELRYDEKQNIDTIKGRLYCLGFCILFFSIILISSLLCICYTVIVPIFACFYVINCSDCRSILLTESFAILGIVACPIMNILACCRAFAGIFKPSLYLH